MLNRFFAYITLVCILVGVAFTLLVKSGLPSISAQQLPTTVAIKNVKVFTGTEVILNSTVIIENGKIISVGKKVSIPKGAEEIDGTDHTLLPGLIDAHTHTWSRDALIQSVMFGVTTQLDMFTGDLQFLNRMKKEQAEGGANDRADIFSAGIMVTATGGHGTQFGIRIPTIDTPVEAQAFVDARIAEGSDYIKIAYDDFRSLSGRKRPTVSKETLIALIIATHKRNKMAVVHISSFEEARDAINAGADGLVHIFSDHTPDAEFIRLIESKKAFVIPTLTVIESVVGFAGGASLLIEPVMANTLPPISVNNLKITFPVKSGSNLSYSYAEETVQQLKTAGVTILAGSDSPNPGTTHGASMHRELELLVKSGLTPIQALTAATSSTATRFRLTDRGQIEQGKRADLFLVKGDPTVDIKATRNIVRVWKGGGSVDRKSYITSVDKMKAAEAEQMRNITIPVGSESGLVSDFEDEKIIAKFGSGWSVSTDVVIGGKSSAAMKLVSDGAQGSHKSLLITGNITADIPFAWGGAMFSPGPGPMIPANLSSKKEISFRVKGDGKTYQVMVYAKNLGYIPSIKTFVAEPEWKQLTFRLSEFKGADASGLIGILFAGGPSPGEYSFQIDDVILK